MTTVDSDQLLASAQDFADRALKAYIEADTRTVLFNAAISLEHLSKAYLCRMSPALLMEIRNGQFDSLLHLTGHGLLAKKLKCPRTISAREAVSRVEATLSGLVVSKDYIAQLIDVRDGVVHVGYLGEEGTREILTAYLRFSNELYKALGVAEEARWGRHRELVNSLISQSLSEIEREVRHRMAAAKLSIEELLIRIPDTLRGEVVRARQRQVVRMLTSEGDEAVDSRCPVCGDEEASYIGEVRFRFAPYAGDSEDAALHECGVIDMRSNRFVCGACGLDLEGPDELRAAGLYVNWEIERCADPSHYYEWRTKNGVAWVRSSPADGSADTPEIR